MQVRTKQEEVDHKEEVLAVLMERYASTTDVLNAKSHLNLGLLGLARQPSVSALSKASLAADPKIQAGRQAQGDIKRLGSSRGRLDIKVSPCCSIFVTASESHSCLATITMHLVER